MSVELYDIDGICLLLAATIKRAQVDAKRGDKAAQRWLAEFASEWRRPRNWAINSFLLIILYHPFVCCSGLVNIATRH